MAEGRSVPQMDSSWKERGSLGSWYSSEQKSDVWRVREQLWAAVEGRIGKSQMYLERIVRAVEAGVGEEYTLALKVIAMTGPGGVRVRSVVPPAVYSAIICYEKS